MDFKDKAVGNILRILRAQEAAKRNIGKLTQEVVASELSYDSYWFAREQVNRLENGRERLSEDNLVKFCKLYGIERREFLRLVEEEQNNLMRQSQSPLRSPERVKFEAKEPEYDELIESVMYGNDNDKDEAFDMLVALGEPAVSSVVHAIVTYEIDDDDIDRDETDRLIDILERIGEPAIQHLIEAFDIADEGHYYLLAMPFMFMQGVNIFPSLTNYIQNGSVAVKCGIAGILSHYPNKRGQRLLLNLLTDDSPKVRAAVCDSLASTIFMPHRASDAVIAGLIHALEDSDYAVRRAAIYAIGKWKISQAVARLCDLMQEGDCLDAIVHALGEIAHASSVVPLIDILKNDSVCAGAIRALTASNDSRAVPPVMKYLKSSDWQVVSAAIELMANARVVDAVDDLMRLLTEWRINHFDRYITNIPAQSAEALGCIGDVRAVLSLIDALHHKDHVVRHRVAVALGKLGDLKAIPPLLVTLMADSSDLVRSGIAEALGNLRDPQSYQALTILVDDKDEHVRLAAQKSLAFGYYEFKGEFKIKHR